MLVGCSERFHSWRSLCWEWVSGKNHHRRCRRYVSVALAPQLVHAVRAVLASGPCCASHCRPLELTIGKED